MKVPEPRKLKSGTYYIQLRLGGESIPVTGITAKKCRDKAQLIKAEYLAGKRITKHRLETGGMTVGEAVDARIERLTPVLSPSTIRTYKSIRRLRFQELMGLRPDKVKDWQLYINRETAEIGAKTVKNCWSLVLSALKDIGFTPPTVVLPKIMPNTRSWLDSEEIPRFISALKGTKVEIAALLGLMGLRRSEILAVTWDKVDLQKKTIRVEGAVVRNDAGEYVAKKENKEAASHRTIPIMIPELVTALEAIPPSDRTGAIVTMYPGSIYKAVNAICKQEGLPLVGVHGLRHSFASLGHHLGIPEVEMMRLGGWANAETMRKIYTHVEQADRIKSENAMTEFFKNANQNAN